jgi:hypothetical protein
MVGNFFAWLAQRRAEVLHGCRRALQAQADTLTATANQLPGHMYCVDLNLVSA